MKERIEQIQQEALAALQAATDLPALDQVRVGVVGKKGSLTALLRGMKDVPADQRPLVGQMVNQAKQAIDEAVEAHKTRIVREQREKVAATERVDISLPGRRPPRGNTHPLTETLDEISAIFERMGFVWEDGPEVETDWHNFGALNFPPDHPARDEQDTFFMENGLLLRTHTSPVQVRVMQRHAPPVRMIAPGWTYRKDAIDATHYPMFSQVEGLLVDEHVTLGDLKGVLQAFVHEFYGPQTKIRLRPSFFPFTEPSAEMDISCFHCDGVGTRDGAMCPVCKGTGWKELLGAGMVDPAVFKAVGYDPEKYTGYAFGMGIERIAQARYGVDELRLFFEGDLRFFRQF